MRNFNIYYDDLIPEVKMQLCKELETTAEEENWDSTPLAVIEREEKIEKIEKGREE